MQPQPKPQTGPSLVRDISSPANINAEIVNDIPVQNPTGAVKPPTSLPPSPAGQSPEPSVIDPSKTSEDKELDEILKDVNSTVKKTENSIEARFEHLSGVRKKVAVKKARIDEAHNGAPPIAATIIACLVALMLSAAAILAFK